MADAADPPPKSSKLPLVIGLVLMLGLGGGGFYAVYSGLLLGSDEAAAEDEMANAAEPMAATAFVELDPILVGLARADPRRQLRFEGHLEVHPEYAEEVQMLMPRIMDVLNSYLRAVELTDLRDPAALVRLRAQMLRRVQIVTGEGRVRDLLVSTFLLT